MCTSTDAESTYTCTHMHTYAHICTHAHAHICTHMHTCTHAHICIVAISSCCSIQVFHIPSKIQMTSQWSNFKIQTGVEECNVEQVEDIPDIVEDVLAHVQTVKQARHCVEHVLNKHIKDIGVLKNQKGQAMKQAKHWQAMAQQHRAKLMKLQDKCDKLEAEHKEYRVQHEELCVWMRQGKALLANDSEEECEGQQPGESFEEWEARVNFPPGVTQPSWPIADLQVSRPQQPLHPPPLYLVRKFKSQTRLGMSKAHPIGQAIGKKHGSSPSRFAWAKAPPLDPPGHGN